MSLRRALLALMGGATRGPERAPSLRQALAERVSGEFPDFGPRSVSFDELPEPVRIDLSRWGPRGYEDGPVQVGRQAIDDILSRNPQFLEQPELAAEFAARETPIPPVLTRAGALVDGRHRVEAARLRGQRDIETVDLDQFTGRPERLDAGDAGGGQFGTGLFERGDTVHSRVDGVAPLSYQRRPGPEPVDPNSWHVMGSYLPEEMRGKGLGIRAYEQMLADARANGVPWVESGTGLSGDARNIYAALERRGYTVEPLPFGRFRVATEPRPPALPDGGAGGGGQFGPSLQDLADEGGFGPGGGPASLVIGALRRARVNLSRLDETGLATQPMPRRSVPLGQIRRTDHTAPEQLWVDEYVANPDHDPIIVRRNKRGGYDIIDGHHRLAAAQARGAESIDAYDASLYFDKNPPAPNGLNGSGGLAALAIGLPAGALSLREALAQRMSA